MAHDPKEQSPKPPKASAPPKGGTLAHLIASGTKTPKPVDEHKQPPEGWFSSCLPEAEHAQEAMKPVPESENGKQQSMLFFLCGVIFLAVVLWWIGLFSNNEEKPAPFVERTMTVREADQDETVSSPQPPARADSSTKGAPPVDAQPSGDEKPGASPKNRPQDLSNDQAAPSAVSEGMQAPVPEPPGAKPAGEEMAHFPYTLHVASFQTVRRVRKAIAELEENEVTAYWVPVDLGDKGSWYRVFVGHFKSMESAREFLEKNNVEADRLLHTAYAVQVGVYPSLDQAAPRTEALRKAGYCPYHIIRASDRYQVLVGAYQTREGADQLASMLQEEGIDSEVVRK